jgi:D-serine/D-alanine/glycine transporter
MPGGPAMVWVTYGFFAFLVWALTTQPDTLIALLVTPIWFVILCLAWLVLRRSPLHQARIAAHADVLREEERVS